MESIINKTQAAVKLSRMLLYLSIVAVMAFLNCLMVRAGDPEADERTADTSDHIQLIAADKMSIIGEVDYVQMDTAQKMLNFSEGVTDECVEEPLEFEAWMFNLELLQEPANFADGSEEELELEPWMLTICCIDLSDLLSEE